MAMPLHSARLLLLVLIEPGPWGIATADAAAAAELWEVHDSVVLALVALPCTMSVDWTKFTCVEGDLRHVAKWWWWHVMQNPENRRRR